VAPFNSSSTQARKDPAPKPSEKPSASRTASPLFQKDTFEPSAPVNRAARYDIHQNLGPGRSSGPSALALPDPGVDLRNVVAPQQFEKGGWQQSTLPVPQVQSDTCGAAAVAMLGGSKVPSKLADRSQYMEELAQRFSDGKSGTTPQEIAQMLAHEGLKVTQGVSRFKQGALDAALQRGDKALALVDSNKILPGGGNGEPGAPHWVVIDGMDDQGNYLVRNPATGRSDYVPASTLREAIDTCQEEHKGGGMLLVKNTPKADEAALAEHNLRQARALGKTPGIGSPSSSSTSTSEPHNQK
jgi:nitrogen fixation protein